VPTFDLSSVSADEVAADLLIVPFYQGPEPGPGMRELGDALGVDLLSILDENQAKGKLGDTVTFPTLGRVPARTVLLVGVGPKDGAGADAVRRATQRIGARIGKSAIVATTLAQVGPSAPEAAHGLAEGLLLGTYRFDRYKRRPIDEASKDRLLTKRVLVLMPADADAKATKAVKAALRSGQIYGEAANWARDLVNTPALDATPDFLAKEATKMAAAVGIECKVLTKAELQKGGFGGILGVGRGSANEPRFIELTYRGAGNARPIAITGKGITFDSGGLSLKPPDFMETMKEDMSGAAATLAAMRAIAQLKLKANVVAAVPSAENMPSGSAIRPGDVLRHYGGKTSEVLNTDAEGRLILADALAYLAEKKPVVLVDSATLTGAASIALGTDLWAVFGNDQELVEELVAAGKEEGEPGWPLPLWDDYRRLIESSIADVKNTGGRHGGAIIAALFLREFVGDVPWAHMDIAGVTFAERPTQYWPRGATGSPARTLVRFVESRAAGNGRRR
jgi:leucyl aminopeptidase